MELWIRSRNKRELVKTNSFYIVRKDKYFHIYCYANNSEIDLGQYGDFEDKTRALEVLDEIQNILIDYKEMSRVVYQMPQD